MPQGREPCGWLLTTGNRTNQELTDGLCWRKMAVSFMDNAGNPVFMQLNRQK